MLVVLFDFEGYIFNLVKLGEDLYIEGVFVLRVLCICKSENRKVFVDSLKVETLTSGSFETLHELEALCQCWQIFFCILDWLGGVSSGGECSVFLSCLMGVVGS